MCDLFHHVSKELSEAEAPAEVVKMNNNYFPKWMGPLIIGFYIAYQAECVFEGTVSLGTFLATIRIFNE